MIDIRLKRKKVMIVTENELIVWCDVDSTLIRKLDYEYGLKLDYYGQPYFAIPIKSNIEFMKSLKARGCHIIVHSNNGHKWAEQVVRALKLENYVDEIKTKPFKVLDDEIASKWIPTVINLGEE